MIHRYFNLGFVSVEVAKLVNQTHFSPTHYWSVEHGSVQADLSPQIGLDNRSCPVIGHVGSHFFYAL